MRGERNQFWDDNVMRWQVPGLSHDTPANCNLISSSEFRLMMVMTFQLTINVSDRDPFNEQELLLQVVLDHRLPSSHLRVWPPIGRPRHCLTLIGRESGTNSELLDSNKQRDSQTGSRCVFCPSSQQSPVFRLARLVRLLSCVIITAPRNPSSEECAMSKVWSTPNYPIIRDWVSVGPLMSHRKHGEQSRADQQLSGILRKLTSDTTGIWTFPKPSPFLRVITADCESISWTHEHTFT